MEGVLDTVAVLSVFVTVVSLAANFLQFHEGRKERRRLIAQLTGLYQSILNLIGAPPYWRSQGVVWDADTLERHVREHGGSIRDVLAYLIVSLYGDLGVKSEQAKQMLPR